MADITLKNVQLNIKWKKDASTNRPALIPTNTTVYEEKTLSSKPTGWPAGYYLDSKGNEPASSDFVSGTYYQATTVTDGTGYVNENLSTTLSKVMRHLTDLKSTAYTDTTSTITAGSNDLATAGAVATYVQTAIEGLPKPMVFRGTLGTGGTITSLPVNGTAEIGDTYKVITSDTYSSQPAKVGDVFVCDTKTENNNTWILIPAGDDVEDTWRSIKVNGTEKLTSGISSGAINFANGTNTTVEWTANTNTLKINASSGSSGSYTQVSDSSSSDAYQIGTITIGGAGYSIYGINSHTYTVTTELIPRTGSTPTTPYKYFLTGTPHEPSGEGIASDGGLYEDTSIYMSGTTGSLYATKFIGNSETQSSGDNSSKIATTAFVQGELGSYIPTNGSTSLLGSFIPATSYGASLGSYEYQFNDVYTKYINGTQPGTVLGKNYTNSVDYGSTNLITSGAVYNALSDKVDKVSGKGLSTNDFTNDMHTKLTGIAAGAEVNVQSDWNVTSTSSDAYIKNKPSLGTAAKMNWTSNISNSSATIPTSSVVYNANEARKTTEASLLNKGSKNILKITASSTGIFTVNSDGTITINGSTGSSNSVLKLGKVTGSANTLVLSESNGPGTSKCYVDVLDYSTHQTMCSGSSATINWTCTNNDVRLVALANKTFNNVVIKPMICSTDDWALTTTFVPYAPTNRELYEMIVALGGTSGTKSAKSGDDCYEELTDEELAKQSGINASSESNR